MTMIQKLMRVVELVNAEGGVTFIKIRMVLEEIQEALENGSPQAAEFDRAMDIVLRMAEYAHKQKFK
jgi:hypothetical protein